MRTRMVQYVIFLSACCLLAACGRPRSETVRLDLPAGDLAWGQAVLENAVDFWAQRGVDIQTAPSGVPIRLDQLEPDQLGVYEWGLETRIRLAADLRERPPGWEPQAVLAHEVGHLIGLPHVEGDHSLMNEVFTHCGGGVEICWSEADQAALDRLESGEEL